MKLRKLASPLARLSAIFAVTTLLVVHAFADDLPTFSDPAVNSYVKEFSDFVGQYADAYKAAKGGDTSKLQSMQEKVQQLQSESATLAGKVKPDEQDKFKQFVSGQSQKLLDILKQQ